MLYLVNQNGVNILEGSVFLTLNYGGILTVTSTLLNGATSGAQPIACFILENVLLIHR